MAYPATLVSAGLWGHRRDDGGRLFTDGPWLAKSGERHPAARTVHAREEARRRPGWEWSTAPPTRCFAGPLLSSSCCRTGPGRKRSVASSGRSGVPRCSRIPTPSPSSTMAAPRTASSTTPWSFWKVRRSTSSSKSMVRSRGRNASFTSSNRPAGSLAEAHDAGLIHRDVKPANILVVDRGGISDLVKVVDFGLVKDVGVGRGWWRDVRTRAHHSQHDHRNAALHCPGGRDRSGHRGRADGPLRARGGRVLVTDGNATSSEGNPCWRYALIICTRFRSLRQLGSARPCHRISRPCSSPVSKRGRKIARRRRTSSVSVFARAAPRAAGPRLEPRNGGQFIATSCVREAQRQARRVQRAPPARRSSRSRGSRTEVRTRTNLPEFAAESFALRHLESALGTLSSRAFTMRTRTLAGSGSRIGRLVVCAAITACNSDGSSGGSFDGGAAASGSGGTGSGGGGSNGSSGGASARTDAGCGTPSAFNGQPGTLYVDTKEGDLILFDTKDGHRLKTLAAPAPRNGVVGGGGLLWIWGPRPALGHHADAAVRSDAVCPLGRDELLSDLWRRKAVGARPR